MIVGVRRRGVYLVDNPKFNLAVFTGTTWIAVRDTFGVEYCYEEDNLTKVIPTIDLKMRVPENIQMKEGWEGRGEDGSAVWVDNAALRKFLVNAERTALKELAV